MAALILDKLESEERWQQAFSASLDSLDRLAANALVEEQAARTDSLRAL